MVLLLVTVQAIRCSTSLLSYFGRVIHDCKTLLTVMHDRNVSIKFVKRSANNVAHYLARSTCSLSDRIIRVSDTPSEFIFVLMKDLIQ